MFPFGRVRYYEPHLDKRFKAAQDKANRVFNNLLTDEDEESDILRFYLATQLGIGVFDEYLTNRTFEELVYEIELYRLRTQPRESRTSELINQNKDELSRAFDSWEEQDMSEYMNDYAQEDTNPIDDDFMKDARAFMETGDFKE